MFLKFIVSILSFLLVSCIPYSHKVRTFPEIYGQFFSSGKERANIEVAYSDDRAIDPCENNVKSVRTSSTGEFRIPAEFRESKYLSFGMVHYNREWLLCFKDLDQNHKWSDSFYGPEDAPKFIFMTCNSDKEPLCRNLEMIH